MREGAIVSDIIYRVINLSKHVLVRLCRDPEKQVEVDVHHNWRGFVVKEEPVGTSSAPQVAEGQKLLWLNQCLSLHRSPAWYQ